MWSYYGAKTNIVDQYPKPKHGKIIEPFAGSARYALKYFEKDVILVDKYEIIARVWQWIQKCSAADILRLQVPGPDQTTNECSYDCVEAKWLMGFIIRFGAFSPGTKVTSHFAIHRQGGIRYSLKRIAENVFKIKHWTIIHGSYENIPNQEATWFIDPPYQYGGHSYVESNKNIDYTALSNWCKGRAGRVIVCESMKADWMEFKPIKTQYTRTGIQREGIWTNEPTHYDNIQQKLVL